MLCLKKIMAYGLLLALPALVGGCFKKDCKYNETLNTDQHAYFIDFKPGDYWIYRNVQNGDLDSVYFVSQTITPVPGFNNDPVCQREYATVKVKGFAKSLSFINNIYSGSGDMSIDVTSDIGYTGMYEVSSQKSALIGGKNYSQTVSTTHCCIEGCAFNCGGIYMRFDHLVFARSVGIVRWEAIRHPQFGTVVYELIRSNRL